jgi:hypothetical protein
MAFWIVSFWFLKYVGAALTTWAYAVVLLALLPSGWLVWKHAQAIAIGVDRQEALALFLLGAAVTLRLSVYSREPLVPAGADMSMHGYIAALIVNGNAVPTSHRPLLPIDGFGAYAVGFQTLTALISLFGGVSVFRSALFMDAMTFGLLTVALYVFLRAFCTREISALVALLATFLPRDPQNYVAWGGAPTLLSLALILVGLGLLLRLEDNLSIGSRLVCALLVTASTLTHLVPVIGLLYASVPAAAYVIIRSLRTSPQQTKIVLKNLLGVGLGTAILLIPYLPSLVSTEISAAEVKWVQDFQRRGSGGAWGGTLEDASMTIPKYLKEKVFEEPFLISGGLSVIALLALRPPLAIPSLIFALTVVGLVINSMYWVLPLSYALYPERTGLLLLLPFSLGIASLLDCPRKYWRKAVVPWALAVPVLLLSARQNECCFYDLLVQYSLVTKADLQAMEWIRNHTEPGDTFENRYGDAGLWIPAIAFRSITDPHLNPFYFDEFKNGAREHTPTYVYTGAKKVYGEPIALDQFESRPDQYRKVYDRDGATIYAKVSQ